MIKSLQTLFKRSLLGLTAVVAAQSAQAQFRYTFKDTTTPYVALSSATSLNGSTIWNDDQFTAPIPFSWTLDSVHTMTSVLVDLSGPGIVQSFTAPTLTAFLFGSVDLIDLGSSGPASLSPISYVTTGTSPNRIFKLEFSNSGFYDDPNLTDYVNFQIWIYETSSIVEYHFGSSSISPGTDYFYTGSGPLTGLATDLDVVNATKGTFYYINGATSPLSIDSVKLTKIVTGGFPANVLPAWPASGKVFRFTPRKAACTMPAATFTATGESALSVRFNFTAPATGLDSLVWDFGDMQKQKVTTGFSAPVTHVYNTAGRYNATVTAYNKCGSTKATASQVRVAVTDIAGLPNVRVYPTIVDDMLHIEGLAAGSKISVVNAAGQLVQQLQSTGTKQPVSFAGLPAGMYIIRMTDPAGAQGSVHVTRR